MTRLDFQGRISSIGFEAIGQTRFWVDGMRPMLVCTYQYKSSTHYLWVEESDNGLKYGLFRRHGTASYPPSNMYHIPSYADLFLMLSEGKWKS